MSHGSNAVVQDYRHEFNPLERIVAGLQRQVIVTIELQIHVDRARESIDAANAPNVRLLLDGLSHELSACCGLLQKRLAALSPLGAALPSEVRTESYWRLYCADGGDCPSHLESLLSGYAHYAKATCDCIEFLERLHDDESARAVARVGAVAEKGLWFIELYMEALALHMDVGHLPEFFPAVGPCD